MAPRCISSGTAWHVRIRSSCRCDSVRAYMTMQQPARPCGNTPIGCSARPAHAFSSLAICISNEVVQQPCSQSRTPTPSTRCEPWRRAATHLAPRGLRSSARTALAPRSMSLRPTPIRNAQPDHAAASTREPPPCNAHTIVECS